MVKVTLKITPGQPGSGGRGFTLLEMIVAIGIVAVVTVGLASIFGAVGKTVTGGRRVSRLSALSTVIERQMRQDFESMTRDGFLVIRQQWVDNAGGMRRRDSFNRAEDVVPLTADDAAPRARRIDEILFFSRGDFTSARQPVDAAWIARASEARIYYGHGERFDPAANQAIYYQPDTFTSNTPERRLGMPGVNRFASDWILLRSALLLTPPRSTRPHALQSVVGNDTLLRDKECQVALQPAAPSLFWHASYGIRDEDFPAFKYYRPFRLSEAMGLVYVRSGIVDIATTSLAEVRSTLRSYPTQPTNPTIMRAALPAGAMDPVLQPLEVLRTLPHTSPQPVQPDGRRPDPYPASVDFVHEWMNSAFPADSDPLETAERRTWQRLSAGVLASDPSGVRMRCESEPTDMYNVFYLTEDEGGSYRRGDQQMLTASNFVPRCTEFIVEWSFGDVDPVSGLMMWHGPQRPDPRDASAAPLPLSDVKPYPWGGAERDRPQWHTTPVDVRRYEVPLPATGAPRELDVVRVNFPATDRLIYGEVISDEYDNPGVAAPIAPTSRPVVTSYFGFSDPTFDPDSPCYSTTNPPTSPTRSRPYLPGVPEVAGRAESQSQIEWAWPKLIRVTMSIADERDPKKEDTLQFVFEVPARSR